MLNDKGEATITVSNTSVYMGYYGLLREYSKVQLWV